MGPKKLFPLLAVAGLAACAGEPPLNVPAAPAPAPTPPPAVTPAPPPLVTADPTALTDAQKSRDAARAPLATAVVDAYQNWGGFFSSLVANPAPDGKHFVFASTRDGLPEIYEGDTANIAAPPRPVTSGPERAIWADYTTDGKGILFLRDEKGDENHHIWRVGVDGSGLVDLTPGEALHRGEPLQPRGKPGTMLFTGRRKTERQTRLFEEPTSPGPGGGEPRLVYTSELPAFLLDVTADGKRALLEEAVSGDDRRLFEIDVASSKARRVAPAEGTQVGISSAAYSADGSRILVATDQGSESSILLALDAKTGKQLARYDNESPKTGPMQVAVSPKGDRIAVRVDAGNHGEIRLLDAHTLKLVKDVRVPLADVLLGSFRRDGKSVSIMVSEPSHPADPFSVDAVTGELRPQRDDKRPGLDGLPPIVAGIDTMKSFDGLPIAINRYLPQAAAGKPLPTVVIFHGGPATSYAVRWNPYARFFVSLGYAVLEPNVRGSSGFGRAFEQADNLEKRADWLKDLESVNAWTKSQPWCDKDRVVVWGQSYGGYTTLMALTRQPSLWRAGVDLYGPADLRSLLLHTDQTIRSIFVKEFGDVDKDAALLDAWSPIHDVDKVVAPLFVYAGQNDPRVPRAESDAIVMALRARSVPVEYMVAQNEGHTVDRRETKIELLTRTARFLEDALR
jgi:dipeptidyl aminopeptidase/acylaminoacyl peptidase